MAGWRAGALALVLAALLPGPTAAEAPPTSPRPLPRPTLSDPSLPPATLDVGSVAAPAATAAIPRPRPRPAVNVPELALSAPGGTVPDLVPETEIAPKTEPRRGLFGFLRPAKRPDQPPRERGDGKRAASVKGAICGDPDIRGEVLAPIKGKSNGCGIADPVRVTSVNGIKLSTGATINCETAQALKSWVTNAVEPIYGRGKVVELHVAASYACRPRNNQRGNRVSEHGRGNAIDIAGFTFANGKQVSVRQDFDKKMRQAHRKACGIFGTTLGPGSDGFHEDHLHFDVARHRNGPYCR